MTTLHFSDLDLADPLSYFGGFKEGRIQQSGDAERVASHPWTGEWEGGQFNFQLSDHDALFRRMKRSTDQRFWTKPFTWRMQNRDDRRVLNMPWVIWVGEVLESKPVGLRSWRFRLGDLVSKRLLSDKFQCPYRMIRDGFLDQLDWLNPNLDLDQPEPIIYGKNIRILGVDPPSPEGFAFTPIYLGRRTVGLEARHVWLVAGHACKGTAALRLDGVDTPAGVDWYTPGDTGSRYEDLVSSTFGTTRRYCLLEGVVGHTLPDAAAAGEIALTIAISGVETIGDGTGDLIEHRFLQYKHFAVHYVANAGPNSYHSGLYADHPNPTWAIYDFDVPIVHTESFNECDAIAIERLPDNDGYIGAFIIGAKAGDQASVLRWIADWNRSCGCRFTITHRGRMKVFVLHPTEAIKAAAILYTDATEVLEDGFDTTFADDEQATQIPFRADLDHDSKQWQTNGVYTDPVTSDPETGYGVIPSTVREYPAAPGITQATHLAILEARVRRHPPQMVTLETTIGPDPDSDDSLAYREIGDYIKYRHFDAVANQDEIRLGQIVRHVVKTGTRRVQVTVIDCEELIGYDDFEMAS